MANSALKVLLSELRVEIPLKEVNASRSDIGPVSEELVGALRNLAQICSSDDLLTPCQKLVAYQLLLTTQVETQGGSLFQQEMRDLTLWADKELAGVLKFVLTFVGF